MKTKVIITDLGNVVLYFDHMITARALGGLLELNGDYVYDVIEESGIVDDYVIGKTSDGDFYDQVIALLVGKHTVGFEEFAEIWGNIFIPNGEMIHTLREIKDRVTLVLLSNTNNLHFAYIEKHFLEVRELFGDRLILSHEVGLTKPDERIYQLALEAAGPDYGYSDCLYIDDIEKYVLAAQNLGMAGHVYSNHKQFEQYLQQLIK